MLSQGEEARVHKRVGCPDWQGEQVGKRGKTDRGKPRERGLTAAGAPPSFLLASGSQGCAPESQRQSVELSLHGSGSRATARGVQSSTATVPQERKKRAG